MNKIGIVTITDGTNYGNRLQNYGLQRTLEKLNYDAETIINNSAWDEIDKIGLLKIKVKSIIKCFLYPKRSFVERKRKYKFKEFNKKFIKFSRFQVSNKLEKINSNINLEYDYFCCGSDQIWNPSFRENAKANFLQFTNKNKRIAYAPSIAVNAIPQDRMEEYKKYFEEIEKISIREDAGARIIKELTGKNVPVLLDPTMLLNDCEWDELIEKPKQLKKQKYILNYFLGEL